METQIVLISGKQGSGKTSLQKKLVSTWNLSNKSGYQAVALNFADIIYEMHDRVLAILHKSYPDRGLVKDGPLLQLLGTEWGRNTLGPDVWVNCLKSRISNEYKMSKKWDASNLLFVIGDCRFENEFDAFPDPTKFSLDGKILKVRLHCSEEMRRSRIGHAFRENVEHQSETGLDAYEAQGKFDMVLDTDGNENDICANHVLDWLLGDGPHAAKADGIRAADMHLPS